jgi:hypothetical protein
LRLQVMVYLSATGGEKLLLRSAPVNVELQARATTRPVNDGGLAELAAQYRRSAFAAKAAHERAVKMGVAARETAAQVARDPSSPDFAREWALATIAEIGGEESAAILIERLQGRLSDHLIAYYGPALRSKALDAALEERAAAPKSQEYLAWLARGYVRARRPLPDDLAQKATTSEEPRARLEVADALAASRSPAHHALLARLIKDDVPAVRGKATEAAARHGRKEPMVLNALVESLDLPGEGMQTVACDALSQLTGMQWRLNPKGTPEENARILNRWRAWDRQRRDEQ